MAKNWELNLKIQKEEKVEEPVEAEVEESEDVEEEE